MSATKAVLLDIDGTLVDSNDAHARAWVDTLVRFGFGPRFAAVRRLIGKGGDKLLPELTKVESDTTLGEVITKQRTERFLRDYLPHIRPFSNARQLLERLRDAGFRLVTASSAGDAELTGLLRIAGVDDLIHRRTSADDADNSKPDPDIVKAALQLAECDAAHAILLGDTPYDVEAATSAKVNVVAVRAGGWRDPDLRGASAIYDDVSDLLARYESSPFNALAS